MGNIPTSISAQTSPFDGEFLNPYRMMTRTGSTVADLEMDKINSEKIFNSSEEIMSNHEKNYSQNKMTSRKNYLHEKQNFYGED